ncbi:MAG: hypothetical protein P9L99_02865 [Candidatus Lernaella stagnicola]|nr:hypothetical protein [Candidatus Lernaella stagnicola]
MRVRPFYIVIVALVVVFLAACGQMGDRYGSTSGTPANGSAPWYKIDLDLDKDLVQSYVLYGDATHYLNEPCYLRADGKYFLFYEVDEIDLDTDIIHDSYIMAAASDDGVDWHLLNNHLPVLKAEEAWETGGVGAPSVSWEDSRFVMYYAGGASTGIGRATSDNGMVWTKSDSNPLLVPNQVWEGGEEGVVGAPSVLHHDGRYRMYYSGGVVDGPDLARRIGYAIGYAESDDGLDFVKRDVSGRDSIHDGASVEPIFRATQEWEFYADELGLVASPEVRVDRPVDRDVYRLYYTGNLVGDFILHDVGIGTAASFDGLEWEKATDFANPIVNERFPLTLFGASQYITYGEFAPSVIKKGNSYRMVFGQTDLVESNQGIGLAVHPRPDSL